jgi:hypothetical protein
MLARRMQGRGMPGSGPAQPTHGDIELRDHAGHERVAAGVAGDDGVDVGKQATQVRALAGAPAIPVGRDRE